MESRQPKIQSPARTPIRNRKVPDLNHVNRSGLGPRVQVRILLSGNSSVVAPYPGRHVRSGRRRDELEQSREVNGLGEMVVEGGAFIVNTRVRRTASPPTRGAMSALGPVTVCRFTSNSGRALWCALSIIPWRPNGSFSSSIAPRVM
jgi:hypothetical protein